jgi:predicted nuclease of restriction endonuclease-like (RecB) superfamily
MTSGASSRPAVDAMLPEPPESYQRTLDALVERVQAARVRALRSVNQELVLLYWDIGAALHNCSGTSGRARASRTSRRPSPSPQSEIAQQITKNPYIFGFLGLDEQATEREVEHGLMAHVERFLLEMGDGFAVVGRQRHLEVGGQDFYIDLLRGSAQLETPTPRPPGLAPTLLGQDYREAWPWQDCLMG